MNPVNNLKELLFTITKVILQAFPQFVAILVLVLFLILGILLFLFNGITITP